MKDLFTTIKKLVYSIHYGTKKPLRYAEVSLVTPRGVEPRLQA